ncbi:hypothetical protein V8E52_002086 [Russula decolorans]|jgi:hypothetical protein
MSLISWTLDIGAWSAGQSPSSSQFLPLIRGITTLVTQRTPGGTTWHWPVSWDQVLTPTLRRLPPSPRTAPRVFARRTFFFYPPVPSRSACKYHWVLYNHTPCYSFCYVTVPECHIAVECLLGTEPVPLCGLRDHRSPCSCKAFPPIRAAYLLLSRRPILCRAFEPTSGGCTRIRFFCKPHSSVDQSLTLQDRTPSTLCTLRFFTWIRISFSLFQTPFPASLTKIC